MKLRPELVVMVDALLAASESTKEIALDAIGETIGTRAITHEEIDLVMRTLEARGRTIVGPSGGDGESLLKSVLGAARALGPELGRKPTIAEIAARSSLTEEQVRHALDLVKIMQR